LDELQAARKILQALKGRQVVVLKELAKHAGFKGAFSIDFKKGFNFLESKGVVKLRQSGWKSEKRGGHNHPKSLLLIADIYEIEHVEQEIDERMGDLDGELEKGDLAQMQTVKLISVKTLFGDPTFVSEQEYEKVTVSKEKRISFWIPKDKRTRAAQIAEMDF